VPPRDDAALKMYERTHWGQVGPLDWRALRCANPRAEKVVELGELVEVVYRTKKGTDRSLTDYEHGFRRELPRLCFTLESRLLVIAGGSYRVNERGIVG
jgi:hypothetical protein